jgi:tetratricopeptide (TPR) repeat protein
MLRRPATILFSCGAALTLSGCPHVTPEKSAREWMTDGRTHSAQERWDDAIADFTEVLRLEPRFREALVLRAHASAKNGDADQALEDCQAALKLQPADLGLLRFRAELYRSKGELAKADRDYRDANTPEHLFLRANQALGQGNYRAAEADFEAAARLDQHKPRYLNQLAWLQAACPDDAVRNGKHAVELAFEACELTRWRDPAIIDTLAAAYAETGLFEEAVKMQQKATDLAPASQRQDYRRRLKVYQENKPYRFVNGQ